MFKVGDNVYVANAYDCVWRPWLTTIKEIVDGKYVCEVKHKNYNTFNGDDIISDVGFDQVFADPLSCREYIDAYYYDALCKNCTYEKDAGRILTCKDCEHVIKIEAMGPLSCDVGICGNTGVQVWNAARSTTGMEICKKYSPTLPQHQDWDWDRYEDLLKNCEFNKECKHHVESCHKTCSYEKYMDKLIRIPVDFEYGNRNVRWALIKRSEWVDLSFKSDDGFWCWGVVYTPEYTKSGRIKRGTVNNIEMFEERKELW